MTASAVVELRNIRTAAIDDPERVVQIGRSILGKGGYRSAGDECTTPHTCFCNADMIPDWTILDQIAVAALITGDDILAKVPLSLSNLASYKKDCIDRLSAQFPTSPRTNALAGMQLEAQEKLSDAADYYERILSQDQTNLVSPSNPTLY